MIKVLSESEPDTLAITISGKLAHDDYATLESELRLRADRDGDFDLIVEMKDIDGLEPSVIRDELAFAKEYSGSIAKMAIVTDDAPWSQLASFVGEPLGAVLGVEVERFPDRVEAWKWLGKRSDENG